MPRRKAEATADLSVERRFGLDDVGDNEPSIRREQPMQRREYALQCVRVEVLNDGDHHREFDGAVGQTGERPLIQHPDPGVPAEARFELRADRRREVVEEEA